MSEIKVVDEVLASTFDGKTMYRMIARCGTDAKASFVELDVPVDEIPPEMRTALREDALTNLRIAFRLSGRAAPQ